MARRSGTRRVRKPSKPREDAEALKTKSGEKPTSSFFLIDKWNRRSPNQKLYYSKLVLGASGGLLAGIVGLTFAHGLLFGLILIILSYYNSRYFIKIKPDEIEWQMLLLKATFTFTVVFIAVWTILIQLLHPFILE